MKRFTYFSARMCGIVFFLNFGLIRFLNELDSVWFEKLCSVQILQLFTTYVIAERLI